MGRQRTPADRAAAEAPPLSLTASEWERCVRALRLSPQQARIVELILRGGKDKQIAPELDLKLSTVRTYLARTFARLDVTDRVGLVVCVCTACIEICRGNG